MSNKFEKGMQQYKPKHKLSRNIRKSLIFQSTDQQPFDRFGSSLLGTRLKVDQMS